MKGLVFDSRDLSLKISDLPMPKPGPGQVLLKVLACGICRTDLHIIDGDLKSPAVPVVLGHQIVGKVIEVGSGVKSINVGESCGVGWLGEICGKCRYCETGAENLCDTPKFTGYTIDGGLSEFSVANAEYCFPIPTGYQSTQAAPLLCAGIIGYRALRMAGAGEKIGFFGFGSSAHILAQIVTHQGRKFYAFTKPNDKSAQAFALKLGAAWAGGSESKSPVELDSAIIFASAGELVPLALRSVRKGGTVVCAGIHMTDIPSFPYEILWGERKILSVANLTREDGIELFKIAPKIPIKTQVTVYKFKDSLEAVESLRSGNVNGSVVINMD